MRRTIGLIAAAAMLLVAGTAQAGLRAVYIDVGKAKQLQIDVHDNGDARIADIASAIDQVLPPIFKGLFDKGAAAIPQAKLTIEPGEAGSAGGRDGRVYHVRGLDSSKPEKVTDYLICGDADLKPVGAALEQFMNASIVPAAPLLGAGARELIEETRAIFALGTPIDVAGRFRLNLAGKAAFPSAYFRLPAPPQTVAQLVAAMKLSMGKAGK